MTLTRWKLLAGVFGISMVGVVAMANPQCPGKTDATREKAPPTREVQSKSTDVPVNYSVVLPTREKSAESLPVPTPVVAMPVSLPRAEFAATIPPIPNVVPLELPTTPGVTPLLQDRVVELPLPGVNAPKPIVPVPELKLELPKVGLDTQISLPMLNATPLVQAETPARAGATPPPPLPATTTIPPQPTPGLTFPMPATLTALPTPIADVPSGIPLSPVPAVEPSRSVPAIKEEVETRVRVVVPLGKSQAKFDVMAGDTVLLQAVCEQVEVRTPTEKGGPVSPIKATGKVRFTAPGCEGTCDSLAVLPVTGEVELTGSVRVTCKHGKAETEIQATTMKFKLGSAPAAVPPSPVISPVGVR